MNALIIYDSQFGNTEKIAKSIADKLSGYGLARAIHVAKADLSKLKWIDLLIVGSPTQAWRPTPKMRALLEEIPELKGAHAAAFDTRFKRTRILTGSAAHGIAKTLKKKGAQLVVPPESFFVKDTEGPLLDGEIKRAERWASEIAKVGETG